MPIANIADGMGLSGNAAMTSHWTKWPTPMILTVRRIN